MPENINLLLEVAVNPGRFDDLKTLIPELVEANRSDAGMLTQELAISDDRQVCHIYERFQDSDALLAHMQSFNANFAARFFDISKLARLVIYGEASVQLKEALAEANPVYMAPLGGFRK